MARKTKVVKRKRVRGVRKRKTAVKREYSLFGWIAGVLLAVTLGVVGYNMLVPEPADDYVQVVPITPPPLPLPSKGEGPSDSQPKPVYPPLVVETLKPPPSHSGDSGLPSGQPEPVYPLESLLGVEKFVEGIPQVITPPLPVRKPSIKFPPTYRPWVPAPKPKVKRKPQYVILRNPFYPSQWWYWQ